ncbi:hypothetical protein BC941DRAFT_472746 [Chlamydoabsidia padenii]|nr:hypothetical protein BC941DRAFT_472746 [Chlamydoabsidia padenii]
MELLSTFLMLLSCGCEQKIGNTSNPATNTLLVFKRHLSQANQPVNPNYDDEPSTMVWFSLYRRLLSVVLGLAADTSIPFYLVKLDSIELDTTRPTPTATTPITTTRKMVAIMEQMFWTQEALLFSHGLWLPMKLIYENMIYALEYFDQGGKKSEACNMVIH